jgi:hypothetical protein
MKMEGYPQIDPNSAQIKWKSHDKSQNFDGSWGGSPEFADKPSDFS